MIKCRQRERCFSRKNVDARLGSNTDMTIHVPKANAASIQQLLVMQAAKEQLEMRQRADAKLRKESSRSAGA